MMKLVSVNIERSKHLDRVLDFLRKEAPDVLCVQELCTKDVETIAEAVGCREPLHVPMTNETVLEGETVEHGLGILSRLPVLDTNIHYYAGIPDRIPRTSDSDPSSFNAQNRMLASLIVEQENVQYKIASTHFTWTPKGDASEEQRKDMQALLKILSGEGEFVLAGDFNAPRGGEMFTELASRYKDNIPAEYETSLDLTLHRAAKERLHEIVNKMVDGLFTTPAYIASDVKLVSNISDHLAIVAHISREK